MLDVTGLDSYVVRENFCILFLQYEDRSENKLRRIVACKEPTTIGIFTTMKQNFGGNIFIYDLEVVTAVTRWPIAQGTDWNQQEVKKARPTMFCLSSGEDYVEMQWDNSTIKCELLLLLEVKIKDSKNGKRKLIFLLFLLFIKNLTMKEQRSRGVAPLFL